MWLLLTVKGKQVLINTDRVRSIFPFDDAKGSRLVNESLEEIYDKIRTTLNR